MDVYIKRKDFKGELVIWVALHVHFETCGLLNQGDVSYSSSLDDKIKCHLLCSSGVLLGSECIKHNDNEVLNHCRIMFS